MTDKPVRSTPPRRITSIRLLAMIALTLALWATTCVVVSIRLRAHPQSVAVRSALAATAIAGFEPWMLVTAKSIFAQDEFNERVHLIAIALTFAMTGLISYASFFLHRAGFVPDLPMGNMWMLMGVLWWLSIMAASRYYR